LLQYEKKKQVNDECNNKKGNDIVLILLQGRNVAQNSSSSGIASEKSHKFTTHNLVITSTQGLLHLK